MSRVRRQAAPVLLLAFGICLGVALGALARGDKADVTTNLYIGQTPEDAADNLLREARKIANEEGSWETIALAQIYAMAGRHDEAGDLLASVTKREEGEWMRIGRLYYRSGQWDQAREAFDQVIRMAPKDEDWLAEIGMYYNLQGDRETAERMFQRSFGEDSDNFYNILKAAGSYLGVEEQ